MRDARAGAAMCIDRVEPLVNLADAVGIVGVLGFRQQPRALDRCGEHGLERRRRTTRSFLREIADARAGRRLDSSAVGLIEPGDDLQQRRFSGTVAADQPDAGFRRQRCRRPIEYESAAQAEGDAVKREHGADLVAYQGGMRTLSGVR